MLSFTSALFCRVLNSTAISGVTVPGPFERNAPNLHFAVVNIDGTDVFGNVLFQYVVPQLTSVPENKIIEAYV